MRYAIKYAIVYTTSHAFICDATDADNATAQFLDAEIEYHEILVHAEPVTDEDLTES